VSHIPPQAEGLRNQSIGGAAGPGDPAGTPSLSTSGVASRGTITQLACPLQPRHGGRPHGPHPRGSLEAAPCAAAACNAPSGCGCGRAAGGTARARASSASALRPQTAAPRPPPTPLGLRETRSGASGAQQLAGRERAASTNACLERLPLRRACARHGPAHSTWPGAGTPPQHAGQATCARYTSCALHAGWPEHRPPTIRAGPKHRPKVLAREGACGLCADAAASVCSRLAAASRRLRQPCCAGGTQAGRAAPCSGGSLAPRSPTKKAQCAASGHALAGSQRFRSFSSGGAAAVPPLRARGREAMAPRAPEQARE